MKVSVIVPVYNLEDFIGPCLESLVTQRCNFAFEVIVANDCSTDNSLSIINEYVTRYPSIVRLIDNEQNLRLAKNMKALLAAATGEYIAYVDGDDLALPGKLQRQSDFLDANPDCGLVYHESEIFDSDSGESKGLYVRDYYNRQYIPEIASIEDVVKYGSFFQASSLMIRRHDHLLETVDEQCKIILDQPFQVLNSGFAGLIGKVDEVLGRYRIHSGSFGAQTLKDYSRREQVLADQLQAISNASKFGVDEAIINQGRAHYYFATAFYFLNRGEEALFQNYIKLSAQYAWYFDDRHTFMVNNSDDFDKCKHFVSMPDTEVAQA